MKVTELFDWVLIRVCAAIRSNTVAGIVQLYLYATLLHLSGSVCLYFISVPLVNGLSETK